MKSIFAILLCLISASFVLAQPPGGATTGGGLPEGERVNPDVPDINDIDLESQGDIDVDTQSEGVRRGTANIPTVVPGENSGVNVIGEVRTKFDSASFNEAMDNFEVPDNWAEIDLSDQMPALEDIQAMRDDLLEYIDIDSLDLQPESDPEATGAIIGYASTMLGTTVTPLYAGEYGDLDLESNTVAQQTISEIYNQLGADMQALLTQADSLSGVTYWALLDNGLALLYTGDCDLDQCTITQESLQVEITSGSMGAYALYVDTIPADATEAQALVESTYPYLATIALEPTESDYGTAFFAFDVDMDSGAVTAYYAGVYTTDSGQSLVYAVSGVGDAYVNVLLGG